MVTVNEMIKGMHEELNLHQRYKEGKEVYYLDVVDGKYGDKQDILKIIKTKIKNLGFNYDSKKEITLEYANKTIREDLFENRLYFGEDELKEALIYYFGGILSIQKEAGISTKRYCTFLRTSTTATLASSKNNFTKSEYLLYLDSKNVHRGEIEVKGVCYKGLESGKYVIFSNENVEKDLDNLQGYYGSSEVSTLIDDIFERLNNDDLPEEISELLNDKNSSNKLNLDDLLNNELIEKLLSKEVVIEHLAKSILNNPEKNNILDRLSTCVGKNLLSRL